MNFARSRSLTVTSIAALALFTASCASDSSPEQPSAQALVTEDATDNTDAPDSSDAQPSDADDTEADVTPQELNGALVDSFPDDVPLYDGDIESSLAALSEVTGAPEWNVDMVTGDPFDTVDAAIREAYSSNGWEIASEMEFGGGPMLITRRASYTVTVSYSDAYSEGIIINYGVSAKG